MAPVTTGHPFLNGLKDIPEDKEEDLRQLRLWLQKQPHLPALTGTYFQTKFFLYHFHFSISLTHNLPQFLSVNLFHTSLKR